MSWTTTFLGGKCFVPPRIRVPYGCASQCIAALCNLGLIFNQCLIKLCMRLSSYVIALLLDCPRAPFSILITFKLSTRPLSIFLLFLLQCGGKHSSVDPINLCFKSYFSENYFYCSFKQQFVNPSQLTNSRDCYSIVIVKYWFRCLLAPSILPTGNTSIFDLSFGV